MLDNLTTAHGRAGTRRAEELHQLCAGYRALSAGTQRTLLHRVLEAFGPASGYPGQPRDIAVTSRA